MRITNHFTFKNFELLIVKMENLEMSFKDVDKGLHDLFKFAYLSN